MLFLLLEGQGARLEIESAVVDGGRWLQGALSLWLMSRVVEALDIDTAWLLRAYALSFASRDTQLKWQTLRHLNARILLLLVHQVHRNEEHLLVKGVEPARVGEVPDARTSLFVQLSLHHQLLHFLVGQGATSIFVLQCHVLRVSLPVSCRNVPKRVLLLLSQPCHAIATTTLGEIIVVLGWGSQHRVLRLWLGEVDRVEVGQVVRVDRNDALVVGHASPTHQTTAGTLSSCRQPSASRARAALMDWGSRRRWHIVIELRERRLNIELDGLLCGRHTVLEVRYETQCHIELFPDEEIVASACSHVPHALQLLEL